MRVAFLDRFRDGTSSDMKRLLVPLLCLAALSIDAGAVEMCRWVDDEGRTHVSDRVPPKFKKSALCTSSSRFTLTESQRRDAEERAAKDRNSLAVLERGESVATDAQDNTPRKLLVLDESQTCENLWRTYKKSQDCFAPYRTKRGVRPEAFAVCTEVLDPSPKCGLPSVR